MIGKVLALSVPFPGAKRPLEEGAKLRLGWWSFLLLNEGQVIIPLAETYVLGAWHPVYEQIFPFLTVKGSNTGVLWTSSVGEIDFTLVEQEYLSNLISDSRISFIWFGDPSLAKAYPQKGFYAPYPIVGTVGPMVEKKDIATLFCPTGPKKNILNQLLAMKLVQEDMKLTLHTNVIGYDNILKDIDHVRHSWLPKKEYYELIASAKVNLAVSFCETLNYQVAEAALLRTESIVSRTIPLPGLRVDNPNDSNEIADKIRHGVSSPDVSIAERMSYMAGERNAECYKILHGKGILNA